MQRLTLDSPISDLPVQRAYTKRQLAKPLYHYHSWPHQQQIHTIGDLLEAGAANLLRNPDVGRKTFDDLKDTLAQCGWQLLSKWDG
jgi:hypothetical protein